MESTVKLSQLTAGMRKYVSEFSSFESNYIFSRFTHDSQTLPIAAGPIRIEGLLFFFVVNGSIKINVNLNPCCLESNTLLVASSSSILEVVEADWDTLDAYALIISPEFMRDINFDINVINTARMPKTASPVMQLDNEEAELLLRYFDLVHANTVDNSNDIYIRSISRCLIAAMAYQLIQFAAKRFKADDTVETPHNRRSGYVKDFMQLVHDYHKTERSVAFYAEKLFISPKYLSLIMKEATGRSAAEWIDEFVILEAKNLLRFSHKNIQQIAYELNFSNQSSFGKYFKNLTGMSPSAYQKS